MYIVLFLLSSFFVHAELTSAPGDIGTIGAPDQCRELRSGETVVVNHESDQSATGLRRAYRLTRSTTDPQLFIAEFNIEFKPRGEAIMERFAHVPTVESDVRNRVNTDRYVEEMQTAFAARTRFCFESMRDHLRAPNGQRLELRLTSSSPQDPGPPRSLVSIQAADSRSNSSSWARDIDCNTIVHEVLHLAGLCDGYTERLMTVPVAHPEGGEAARYSCRSIEPADSIMRDHTGLRRSYEVIRCTQAPGAVENPVSTQVTTLPTVCPGGLPIKRLYVGLREYGQMVAAENNRRRQVRRQNSDRVNKRDTVFFFYREAPPPSNTLYPAQMRLITQPFCNSANQRYIDCAQNAYRTRELEGCAVVPDYCQNSDFLQ